MKRFIIFIIIILVAAGILVWRLKGPSAPTVKTEKVSKTSITKTVSASGKVGSEEEVELKFQASGLLTWVGVKEGDAVQAGQTIAQLDTRELQKNLEKYLRDYSSERNDFEEARRNTYNTLDPNKALTDTIKRVLEKNQWDLDKAVLDVELKDIALKFATLTTPIDGIITEIDTPVSGVNITPATAVFKIANPDKMIFKANIDEADIGGATPNLLAKITLDAYPGQEFDGNVKKIDFASTPTSGGGTAFLTEISLPKNDNLKFKVGMNGDADVILESKNDVIAVSSEAVFKKNGLDYVWLIKNGRVSAKEISVGLTTDDQTEIKEGLSAGDKVVSSDVAKLKEGQKIAEK